MMPQATQTIPRRPLIGVTGGLNEKGFLNIRNGYMQSVVRAGGIPVLLPLDAPEEILRDAFERMDGVLISGGADIDPALYGEETLPECGALDPARDRQEMLMVAQCWKAGIRHLPRLSGDECGCGRHARAGYRIDLSYFEGCSFSA